MHDSVYIVMFNFVMASKEDLRLVIEEYNKLIGTIGIFVPESIEILKEVDSELDKAFIVFVIDFRESFKGFEPIVDLLKYNILVNSRLLVRNDIVVSELTFEVALCDFFLGDSIGKDIVDTSTRLNEI